jgi:hypothetical protein
VNGDEAARSEYDEHLNLGKDGKGEFKLQEDGKREKQGGLLSTSKRNF